MEMTYTMDNDDMDFSNDSRWSLDLDDGLVVRGTERPDSPVLEEFFAGYDRAFVLPDEREELEGFRACLTLNPLCRHRFGRRHRELVLVLNSVEGHLLGGANFLTTYIKEPPPGHPPVAVALNYIYVQHAARGRGLSRLILDAVVRLANRAVGLADDACWPALFIEQNDPLRLTEAEYATDSSHAGIDQIDRLALWSRLGARLIDFPYVQPALSKNQAANDGLLYAVVRFARNEIDAEYFRAHLESFFGISVLKGRAPSEDPDAKAQLMLLAEMAQKGEVVAVRAMEPALTRLRALAHLPPIHSFREFTATG